jgi:hypothetical protein
LDSVARSHSVPSSHNRLLCTKSSETLVLVSQRCGRGAVNDVDLVHSTASSDLTLFQ